jgi:hypothetical protein
VTIIIKRGQLERSNKTPIKEDDQEEAPITNRKG